MGDMTPEEIQAVADRADCLYSEDQVEAAIDKLADLISGQLGNKNPIILCVMNGGLILCGKLATRLNFPLQMDSVHASRYRGATSGSDLQWKSYPSLDLSERAVLIVDDIFDEGATLEAIVKYCKQEGAAEVYSAVLVDKIHDRKLTDMKTDFLGMEVVDRYLFGYGMDYKGYLRNAAGIFAIADEDM
jgi:hypoxanthine phosphoribosyltransferase